MTKESLAYIPKKSKKIYFLTKHVPSLLIFEMAKRKQVFNRFLKLHPYTANFNLTDKCNSRCITCNQWRSKSYNELKIDELKNILNQLSFTTVRNVHFGGGEPMLRQDIFELIEYASELGFNVAMVTNGLLINQKNAKKLVSKGLKNVCISIDGPEPIHDKIRGIKGAYQQTLIGLKAFTNLKKETRRLDINIAATIMKPTLRSIFHVVKLAEELNVTLSFNLIDSNPYFFNGIEIKDLWIDETQKLDEIIDKLIAIKIKKPSLISNNIQSLEYAKQYFRDPLRKDIPCYLGLIELFFDPHGNVLPCWALKPVGSLREKKLAEILGSNFYRSKLNDMWAKNCPGCSCGYIPNLDFDLSASLKEFSILPWFTLKRVLAL